jgi:transposase-like protein
MKRKVNHIPDEIKFQIVQEYINTGITREELQQKYDFRGNNCISSWMLKFGIKRPNNEQVNILNQMSKEKARTPREQELELRVKKLETELEREKLRSLALTTIIDIAERELHIPIRKKSGAKR